MDVQQIQERSCSTVHRIGAVATKMRDDEFPADLGLDQACDRDPRPAHFGKRPGQQADAEALGDQINVSMSVTSNTVRL